MSTDVKIVHSCDFIIVTPQGQLDREKTGNLLKEIASATAPLRDYEILVDTRKAQSGMSISDLWYLAAQLSNLGQSFSRKTAVLCPRERFDQAGFFALCAQNRGFLVNPFLSFEDAMEWLMAEGP